MAEQRNAVSQIIFLNKKLQTFSLRPLSRDRTLKIEATLAQMRARPHQECMVFHFVQTSNRQQGKSFALTRVYSDCGFERIHTQPANHDFAGIDPGELPQNVVSIVF